MPLYLLMCVIYFIMSDIDVKQLRLKMRLTQEQMAEMLGVHKTTVQNWERGHCIPVTKKAKLREIDAKVEAGVIGQQEDASKPASTEMLSRYDDLCMRVSMLCRQTDLLAKQCEILAQNASALLQEVKSINDL